MADADPELQMHWDDFDAAMAEWLEELAVQRDRLDVAILIQGVPRLREVRDALVEALGRVRRGEA